MTPKHLPALSLLFLAACGGSDPKPEPGPPPCDPTGLAVSLSSPSAPVTTRSAVQVQVSVSGDADKVELLRDGSVLAELPAPYSYAWETAGVADGAYTLSARATCNGTRVNSSNSATVTVDRTAPTIALRTPAPGAELPAGTPSIRIDFSEPLRSSSVSATSFNVAVNGQPVMVGYSLSQDGRSLTLTLTQALTPPSRVEVALGSGVTDQVGNSLATPSPWAFTVPLWVPAHGVVPAPRPFGPYTQLPVLQLDSAGRPAVGFRAATGPAEPHQYLTRRWTGSGTEWASLAEDLGGSYVSAGTFAMGSEDRFVVAVVLERGDSTFNSYYFAPGRDPTSEPSIFNCYEPTATVGPRGTSLVACSVPAAPGARGEIILQAFNNIDGSDHPSVLSTSLGETLRTPSLTADASDRPVLAYVDGRGHLVVKRSDGVAWTQLGATLPTRGISGEPTVRMDPSGRPVVAWRESDGSGNRVLVHRLVSGTWTQVAASPAVALPPTAASSLSMVLDGQGQPVLAWTESGSSAKVNVQRYSGSAWTSLGEVSRVGSDVLAGRGALALDSEGNPVVATVVRTGSSSDVQIWRLNR